MKKPGDKESGEDEERGHEDEERGQIKGSQGYTEDRNADGTRGQVKGFWLFPDGLG